VVKLTKSLSVRFHLLTRDQESGIVSGYLGGGSGVGRIGGRESGGRFRRRAKPRRPDVMVSAAQPPFFLKLLSLPQNPNPLMSKRKLFIVEDDPMFAEMLIDFMKSKPQWEVAYFPSGEECVSEAYQDPDVVIIDYHLDGLKAEGINGLETMKKLKKIAPGAHCIFLSGQQKYGVALQTISQGAENYVFKDENAFNEIGKILDGIPVD